MTNYAPLPRIDPDDAETVFEPPGRGEGHWVGAPSVHRHDGTVYLGVRWRTPERRGHAVEIYERTGSGGYDPVFEVTADELDVESLERPCLVTDPRRGTLKLYLSADRGENDWTILKLADAGTPDELAPETAAPVLTPAAGTTDRETVKDPFVMTVGGRYYMYYAGHDGRSEQAHLATSPDGETWERSRANPVLARTGWHDYHTRVSCVVPARDCPAWHVLYEGSGRDDHGRVWNLRTGTALSFDLETVVDTSPGGPWLAAGGEPGGASSQFETCRYVDVLTREDGHEVLFEAARDDGSFDLRRTVVSGFG